MDIDALPQYILWQNSTVKITPLKLQKLLYYVKAWGLVAGMDLFEGEFYKWPYGPVNPEVYHTCKQYGRSPIPPPITQPALPAPVERELIDFIIEAYLPFSPTTLSAMTHKEAPWRETPDNAVISHAAMRRFYARQPFAKNLASFDFVHKPYYPVQGDSWHAFVLDMSAEDAHRHTQFASYAQYREYFKQAQADITDLEQDLANLFDL
jgi:uncharacterized phage-associated protein